MQNSITINVAECNAKKLAERLHTIAMIVNKINLQQESDRPGPTQRRVSVLSSMDDRSFIAAMTREAWV